jgi:hypothetical protein
MPSWLLFLSTSKSEELSKVRRRTDEILKNQEAQKEHGIDQEREMLKADSMPRS